MQAQTQTQSAMWRLGTGHATFHVPRGWFPRLGSGILRELDTECSMLKAARVRDAESRLQAK